MNEWNEIRFTNSFSESRATGLLKSNFKYYNSKTSKTTEKDVYKFDEEFKSLDRRAYPRT